LKPPEFVERDRLNYSKDTADLGRGILMYNPDAEFAAIHVENSPAIAKEQGSILT
jgi:hypothetical protein